jgi:6-phosphogluconolactonase (cycloisomerase 2 family)
MSLWRRISASTNLLPEGEQYVVVYAGNTATTDSDLNLVAYPFDSVNGFGDRLVPAEFIGDGFQGGGRIAFSPSGGGIAAAALLSIEGTGEFGLASYEWDEGFGTQFTSGVADRGPDNVVFHPDGDVVFVSHAQGVVDGSKVFAYNWSDATGYGSTRDISERVSNPYQDFMPLALSPNGQFLAVGYGGSVNLAIFPFSKSTGFGTKVEPSVDPISDISGTLFDVAWNNAGTYVAVGCISTDATKRLHIWAWDNATGTLGAKVADTDISVGFTSTSGPYSIIFSPDDEAIILGIAAGPDAGLAAFSWDNATGTFGAQYNAPDEPVPYLDYPRDLKFNANGNVLFASGGDSAQSPVMAYQWDNETGFGSRYDDPDSTGIGTGYNAYSIDYINLG